MRTSKNTIIFFALLIFLSPVFFFFSMSILVPYTEGDQRHYRAFYYFVESATLHEAFLNTQRFLGAIDVIYPVVVYVGATVGFDKDVYFSLFNVLLMCLIVANGIKYRCGMFFIFLAVTNFYTIVLLASAERLKFAFILLLIVTLTAGAARVSALILAPLAHFQTLILYAAALPNFISIPRRFIRRKHLLRNSVFLFFALATIGVGGVFFGSALISTGIYYADRFGGAENIAQVFLLLILSQIVLRNRLRALLSMCIFIFFVGALGGQRVNMIAVYYFIASAASQGKANHPLVLLLMVYFSIRSIDFIENILVRGNGFDWGA